MTDGAGGYLWSLVGFSVLICGLIAGAVLMYGKQSAKKRTELEAKRNAKSK